METMKSNNSIIHMDCLIQNHHLSISPLQIGNWCWTIYIILIVSLQVFNKIELAFISLKLVKMLRLIRTIRNSFKRVYWLFISRMNMTQVIPTQCNLILHHTSLRKVLLQLIQIFILEIDAIFLYFNKISIQ